MNHVLNGTAKQIETLPVDVNAAASFILSVQKPNGEIPWSHGGKTDLWDHIESAMGLSASGRHEAAEMAYEWAQNTQLSDGSWWSYYQKGSPEAGAYKDANMIAYIAVGVYHHYLATKDWAFLLRMWPTVEKAIEFVIAMQGSEGQIFWAQKADGANEKRALLTGSCSIYLSLKCACRIAEILGLKNGVWKKAAQRLKTVISNKPHMFDPTKARFSMDWYYPVLCGAITGNEAIKRIHSKWDVFTIPGWGIRCVSDQPWLTMAETAEFILALSAMGSFQTAMMVYGWLRDKHYGDGAYWTGVTYPDRVIYTEEKTAWTSAAVLLATDALFKLTPARRIFSHDFWDDYE